MKNKDEKHRQQHSSYIIYRTHLHYLPIHVDIIYAWIDTFLLVIFQLTSVFIIILLYANIAWRARPRVGTIENYSMYTIYTNNVQYIIMLQYITCGATTSDFSWFLI